MNVAIVYVSLSGNTEEIAEVISEKVENFGGTCTLYHVSEAPASYDEFDIVIFGSYTWNEGTIPDEMRDELRFILKEEQMPIKKAAVFGSGDEIFPFYCRAVDEIIYHLKSYGVEVVADGLKIEQSCRGSQTKLVIKWTEKILNGGMKDVTNED